MQQRRRRGRTHSWTYKYISAAFAIGLGDKDRAVSSKKVERQGRDEESKHIGIG